MTNSSLNATANAAHHEEYHKDHNPVYFFMTVVFLMLSYFISEALIDKYKPRFGHPSGVALVLGIVFSFIVRASEHDKLAYVFRFEEDLFFALILPPIVFSAGFNMH